MDRAFNSLSLMPRKGASREISVDVAGMKMVGKGWRKVERALKTFVRESIILERGRMDVIVVVDDEGLS